ncbi:ATP-binding protein [Novosphingobium album (ex Liu et al. 2023)]|uniref:ATP-binding protein n=1 Tax=Novosphingobium album (ex Liu et al. 2023) TaxID=3031130 RepID=A0ABT5WKN2_9SPHN|nr:ATP-binding protein [Novosphingobium album (ex Liu et al. 2023)]MDE8650585.1 ATP-binding protein [Novosphingobium album (ex Liu et al. 2023)]
MSLPTVIRSRVDPAAITKVTRLFNNTLGDILTELIQNARRAGATVIDLDVAEAEGRRWLAIADDGAGIADPAVILALGRSGWDDEVARREDPAGMGVFSLAGRHVEIRSCARGQGEGWAIAIGPDDWESRAPIAVVPCAHPFGTEIRLLLEDEWAKTLEAIANGAARYCPTPIRFNGAALPRADWLAGAEVIVETEGVRIGLFNDTRSTRYQPRINFHGLTVPCVLPSIDEKDRHWWARVDIVDAPTLQLVLPARKEMVENAALEALRGTVRKAIYRHIASLGSHRLPFEQWAEARELGIDLPEAAPVLRGWTPAAADRNSGREGHGLVPAGQLVLVGDFGPPLEQCAAFALARDGRLEGRLADPDDAMAGYGWYDALARITALGFEIERDGVTSLFDGSELPGLESGLVDRLDLVVEISGPQPQTLIVAAPVVIEYDEGHFWSFEEANILLASRDAVSPEELVYLLEAACFCASDDHDADSWETQNDRFLLDAREMATRLLLGDDAALVERLRAIIAYRAQWFVPEGRQFSAVIGRDAIAIQLEPAKPETAS